MRYPGGSNLKILIASLQASAQTNKLTRGKEIHAFMLKNNGFFLTSPASTTSLINMYSKCNSMNHALTLFDTSSPHHQNVFAYNAIIAGFIANDMPKPALDFYWGMRVSSIMPDKFTFPSVIKACADVHNCLEGRKVHGLVFKLGLEWDVFVGSALVHLYLRFGFTEEAYQVFDELPVRDVVMWNAMINGFAQTGLFGMALEVYKEMGEEGILPSRFTVTGILSAMSMMGDLNNGRAIHGFVVKMGHESAVAVMNALVDMYGKCKCLEDALKIFEMIPEKDIFSWNSILCVHEQGGDHHGTLGLLDSMSRAGVKPDLVTVTTILPACAHLAALMHGREIHSYMIINGLGKEDDGSFDDVYVKNAVMDMYAKCGSMREAHLVFDKMSYKDVASWNIMIMGYGMHGFGSWALDMFSNMCEAGLKPDEVSFVGVLSACSHVGLVSEGQKFLAQMDSQYGVIPTIEHYTCVIDMLGRAGQLKEAYELVSTMPIEASSVVWRAFLAACRLHGNAALAEVAAQRVLELEPEHCGNYVLMSNIYGAVGRYEEVSEVRLTMRQQNVRKEPGCSWIELGDGVHVFVTGDRRHPEDYLIYAGLNSLNARLYECGSMPSVYHDIL